MCPKISIIIPIYNVEMYLKKCIESVLNQTFKDFELILINDGSTDKSGDICEMYAQENNRIKVIHKKNGGQSTAKNIGLDIAKGNYIGFIDGDDWIEPDMYETLYSLIKETDKDIANIGIKSISKDHAKILSNHEKKILNRVESIEELFKHELYGNFFCTNLFKKSLFEKFRFKEGIVYEDVDLLYRLIHESNGLVTVGQPKYNYLIRQGSTTGNAQKIIFLYKVMEEQKKWLKKKYPILYKEFAEKLNYKMNISAFVYISYLKETNQIKDNLEDFYKYSKVINNHFKENLFSKNLIWKTKVILTILKISPKLYKKIFEKI